MAIRLDFKWPARHQELHLDVELWLPERAGDAKPVEWVLGPLAAGHRLQALLQEFEAAPFPYHELGWLVLWTRRPRKKWLGHHLRRERLRQVRFQARSEPLRWRLRYGAVGRCLWPTLFERRRTE